MLPLCAQPGTVYRYSFATDVLGYLVEVVSGKSFNVYLKECIFDPLGMKNTLCPDGTTMAGPTGKCLLNPDGTLPPLP